MPGNTIQINNYKPLTWYIGDSKMEDLIQWLDKHGFRLDELELDEKLKGR